MKLFESLADHLIEVIAPFVLNLLSGFLQHALKSGNPVKIIVTAVVDLVLLILDLLGPLFNSKIVDAIVKLSEGMVDSLTGAHDNIWVSNAIKVLGYTPANYYTNGATPDTNDLSNPYFLAIKLMKEGIMPTAMTIFALIVMIELFQITLRTEGMRNSGFEAPFKLMIKVAVCKILLDNTQQILETIFNLGVEMFNRLHTVVEGIPKNSFDFSSFRSAIENMTFTTLAMLYVQTFIQTVLTEFVVAIIPVVVFGRMLEIYIFIILAPIPFATFAHQEFSTIGKNFTKNMIALSFKAVVIYLIVIICGLMTAITAFSDMNAKSIILVRDLAQGFLPNFWAAGVVFAIGLGAKPLLFAILMLTSIFTADKYAGRISGQFY
jgi:hypothetical protein